MPPEIAKSYRDYLGLDKILNSSDLRLSLRNGEPVHDETLFILLHQTIELWFYQTLAECNEARRLIREDQIDLACEALERVGRIFIVLTASWDVLATLKPREFWEFRRYFGSASGFQSAQFREMEFVVGLRGDARTYLDVHLKEIQDETAHGRLKDELGRPSLWDEVNKMLARCGFFIPSELISRQWSEAYPYPRKTSFLGKGLALLLRRRAPRIEKGSPEVEKAWLCIHSRPSAYPELYRLGERLLDLSAAFSSWRFKHIVTVERFIGGLPGTGGSSGVPYLIDTLVKRAFPELWSVRDRFRGWAKPSEGC